ncbi:MAG: protease [Candidatus Chaera renei]|uniref:Protease HtpX homolog n=1 Tax=Candidatus Chaera renei TaxID=2506947 RepID=A0A4Q0AK39_9BACT|nr:MAG: protease [Candidatus Chaera renei]
MYSAIAANKRNTLVIMALFIGIITGLGWVGGQLYGNGSWVYWALAFGLAYALIQYFIADKLALAVNGAKPIAKSDNPRLYRIVENLSIASGMPTPKIYVMNDPAANAFATGRNPAHASVAATTGLLDIMDDDELEAVMAHEMGHVKNYDIRVMMIVFGLVSAIGLLADGLLRIGWFGGGNDNRQVPPIFYIIGIIAILLAPLAALLVQLAVSRQREYLADATGAMTTRYPEALASALSKIAQQGSATRAQNGSTAHLFFANPLKGKMLTGLFSTHPPIEQRIKRLREMAGKF